MLRNFFCEASSELRRLFDGAPFSSDRFGTCRVWISKLEAPSEIVSGRAATFFGRPQSDSFAFTEKGHSQWRFFNVKLIIWNYNLIFCLRTVWTFRTTGSPASVRISRATRFYLSTTLCFTLSTSYRQRFSERREPKDVASYLNPLRFLTSEAFLAPESGSSVAHYLTDRFGLQNGPVLQRNLGPLDMKADSQTEITIRISKWKSR